MNSKYLKKACIPLDCVEHEYISRDFVAEILQNKIKSIRALQSGDVAEALEKMIFELADFFDVDCG